MLQHTPTLTPEEVAQVLRAIGVRTTATRIREGIRQGKYPFGIVIDLATPTYEIYRKDFEKWLREKFDVNLDDVCVQNETYLKEGA